MFLLNVVMCFNFFAFVILVMMRTHSRSSLPLTFT